MINSVRETTLAILNKHNYGNVSPSDFNLYAHQAQLELFEEHFAFYNKAINMVNNRTSGTDYADLKKASEEVLDIFLVSHPLSYKSNNTYYVPSLITTGDVMYMVNNILCYKKMRGSGVNTNIIAYQLEDSFASFITNGVKQNDVVVSIDTSFPVPVFKYTKVVSVLSSIALQLEDDIFPSAYTNVDYKIWGADSFGEAEKVSKSKIGQLNASLLTSPTVSYPSYVQNNGTVTIYPETINGNGQVECVYFRYPTIPKWSYITITGGEALFNASAVDYKDFELPSRDEYKLVMKIVGYCGVSLQEKDVAAFALGQEAQTEQKIV